MRSLSSETSQPGFSGKTLHLDLGTRTGWAVSVARELQSSGTLLLATEAELQQQRKEGKERTLDLRFSRLLAFIVRQIEAGVGRIVFEDVEFCKNRAQAAVDRGEQMFLSGHARKAAREQEKRERKAARKAKRKARKLAAKLSRRDRRNPRFRKSRVAAPLPNDVQASPGKMIPSPVPAPGIRPGRELDRW
jgi:hypothetical protein